MVTALCVEFCYASKMCHCRHFLKSKPVKDCPLSCGKNGEVIAVAGNPPHMESSRMIGVTGVLTMVAKMNGFSESDCVNIIACITSLGDNLFVFLIAEVIL